MTKNNTAYPIKNICLDEFCSLLNSLSSEYKIEYNNYHTYFSHQGRINYHFYCIQKDQLVFLYFRIPKNPALESLLDQSDINFFWDDKNYKYRITVNSKLMKKYSIQIKEWIRQTLETSNIRFADVS